MARRNQNQHHPRNPAHPLPESLAGRSFIAPGKPGNKAIKRKPGNKKPRGR